jgi:hypothetical protein
VLGRLLPATLGLSVVMLLASVQTAEAQNCPAGYRWSHVARRCLKRCGAGSYYSYSTGRCIRRGRRYKRCARGWYYSASRRRCIQVRRCSPGWFYSYTEMRCKRLKKRCGPGYFYSFSQRRCKPRCVGTWRWNGSRCVPRATVNPRRCRPGWRWNGMRCVPPGAVVAPIARRCGTGWYWSSYYNRCVRRRVTSCPPGSRWNGYRCRRWRKCSAGYYWSAFYKSCRPRVKKCPYGYRYRPGWGCQRMCASGWRFIGGRCQKVVKRHACPGSMRYSFGLRRCVKRCGGGYYWSYRHRRCKRRRW